MDLDGNGIVDASPLVGLKSLTYLKLEDNHLDKASIEMHISAIEANGARVDFDLPPLPVELGHDGMVDVEGLVFVASRFGHVCPNEADLNGYAVIDILDRVMVAREFGTANEG